MKRLTLAQVRSVRAKLGDKPIADYAEARKHVGDNFATANQAHALSMLTRLNTREDWCRLEACIVILTHRRRNKR
jgi:hypothetical protein